MYKPGDQPPSEILMKDLAIWLGKYAGMSYIHAVHVEGYAKYALVKTADSNMSQIGKRQPRPRTILVLDIDHQ